MFLAKIYSDGENYIGIPQSEIPIHKRRLTGYEKHFSVDISGGNTSEMLFAKLTRKEIFEHYYNEVVEFDWGYIEDYIVNKMLLFFEFAEECRNFVRYRIDDKKRSIISKKQRFFRKARLNQFNYFCTFTYDDKKQTEKSFKRKIMKLFQNLYSRHNWKYMYVFERGEENDRLHIHGLFYIPDGEMLGELVELSDYSTKAGRIKTRVANTYFEERFGRTDFEALDWESKAVMDESCNYILKYITKSNNKIHYSRKTPPSIKVAMEKIHIVCKMLFKPVTKFILDKVFGIFTTDGEYLGLIGKDTIPLCSAV